MTTSLASGVMALGSGTGAAFIELNNTTVATTGYARQSVNFSSATTLGASGNNTSGNNTTGMTWVATLAWATVTQYGVYDSLGNLLFWWNTPTQFTLAANGQWTVAAGMLPIVLTATSWTAQNVQIGTIAGLPLYSGGPGALVGGVITPQPFLVTPRPTTGNSWAVIGDSISANGGIPGVPFPPSGGYRTQASQGFTSWLTSISLQQIDIQPSANFSLSGRTTADCLTQVSAVIAYGPDWCIVECGTNDPGNGLAVAATVSNLSQIFTGLLNAGINVMVIPVTPRTSPNGLTSTGYQNVAYINNYIRRFAHGQHHARMVIADPRETTWMNTATQAPASGVTQDGLHPNQAGAKIWASYFYSTVLAPFMQQNDTYPVCYDVYDTYDAVQNPSGNLMTNWLFTTATGGTLNDSKSIISGSVPSGWTAIATWAGSAYTGTIALSNTARTDGKPGNWFTVTTSNLSGTGGGVQDHLQLFQQVSLPAGITAGMWVEATVEIMVNATSGFNGFDVDLGLTDGGGNTYFYTGMGPAANSASWPQGTYHVVIKTPRALVMPATGGSGRVIQGFMNLYFDTSATGPCTATIQCSALSVRPVIFP